MPAKWQKWMPFHIDRFMGSLHVQAMHPGARAGYIYLLAAQWQSEDCTLAADDYELAVLSGMGAWWQEYKPIIMRHFSPIEDGRLRNAVLFEEWTEAKRIFEARRKGANTTNDADAADTDAQSERTPKRSASRSANAHRHTCTGTETKTDTTKQKQKPSGDAAPEADFRHVEYRDRVHAYWRRFHPDVDLAPWDGGEAKQLKALLAANPALSPDGFKRLLEHRAASEVNHSARPRDWLPKLTDYARGPLDRFNQPKKENDGTNNANTGTRGAAVGRVERGIAAVRLAAQQFGWTEVGGNRSAAVGRVERSQRAFRQAALESVAALGWDDIEPNGGGLALADDSARTPR